MEKNKGHVVAVNGNMVDVQFEGSITKNEVAYIHTGPSRLKSEVIRIKNDTASMQVYEMTGGVAVGDEVEFTGSLLDPAMEGILHELTQTTQDFRVLGNFPSNLG